MEHNYQIGRLIGRGSFATVHLARRQSFKCALKLVDLSREGCRNDSRHELLQLMEREIAIHATLVHKHIVSFVESFTYNNGYIVAISLEYCSGGDLSGYFTQVRLRRRGKRAAKHLLREEDTFLSAIEIRHAISHILAGLAYLHSMGIVHRDIKGGNIFLIPSDNHNSNFQSTFLERKQDEQCADLAPLTHYTLKIGDFGLAIRMDDDDDWDECRMTICGTPSCLAPEVVRGCNDGPNAYNANANETPINSNSQQQPCQQGYGQPADLWSTGCLLYTMIVGRNPFALPAVSKTCDNHDIKMARLSATIDRVAREDWALPANVKTTSNLEGLLNQLLESTPRKRGTARDILDFHPFFTDDISCTTINRYESIAHDKEIVLSCRNSQHTTCGEKNGVGDISPMRGLCRLPLNKYGWKEGNRQFTLYLLCRDGLVVHETTGCKLHRWMHITSDGLKVFCWEIPEHDQPTLQHNDTKSTILQQAFKNAPSSYQHTKNNHNANHQTLHIFLRHSNKRNLRLYRSAEKLVNIVKANTPKVIVYICSTKSGLERLFAKAMLMENGPHADIECTFVEGPSFQLRKRKQEKGIMSVIWKRETFSKDLIIQFDPDKVLYCSLQELVSSQNDNDSFEEDVEMIQQLSRHFEIVQAAVRKCLVLEQKHHSSLTSIEHNYPISVRMDVASIDML